MDISARMLAHAERVCEDAGLYDLSYLASDATALRIHASSPHYPQIRTLPASELGALQDRFTAAVARLEAEHGPDFPRAPVPYAYGLKAPKPVAEAGDLVADSSAPSSISKRRMTDAPGCRAE